MSWSQDYSVPSFIDLLIQLTGKHPEELLEAELNKLGLYVTERKEITLDDGMYEEVKGLQVRLSDGRVFLPKLTQRFTADGNYGLDTYEYFPEDETPNVSYTSADRGDEDETVVCEYGETDEAELASDGELENE